MSDSIHSESSRDRVRAHGEDGRAEQVYLSTLHQELCTPIIAIIGYSEMLLEEVGGAASTEDLKKVLAAGRRLLELTDDLFEVSRRDAGAPDMEALRSTVRHELLTPLNHIIGYSEMLIEDAQDAGDAGLERDLEKIHASGKQLVGLVDDIVAADEAGRGALEGESVFLQRTAMARAVATTIEGIDEDRGAGANEPLMGRLLVVDDNRTNRELLVRRLERGRHEVSAAANGKEALETLRSQSFDVVFLDIVMPELNGYQVLEAMKRDPKLRDIPVIMISAMDEIDSAVRCIKMGAEDYLPKPFNPVILKARLDACLEKKKLRDREVVYLERIEAERRRSDELLHVIFPDEIVKELKSTNTVMPRRHEYVAVLFSDIVDFTPYCNGRDPEEIIDNLQQLVEAHEELVQKFGMQKIKTIGDALTCASGLLAPTENAVLDCVRCGIEMIRAVNDIPADWNIRVGIHAGPVVAGVLGRQQYTYDLFGDTVNTAARMESCGAAGTITLSEASWRAIESVAEGESLGLVDVKGKGKNEIFRFLRFR